MRSGIWTHSGHNGVLQKTAILPIQYKKCRRFRKTVFYYMVLMGRENTTSLSIFPILFGWENPFRSKFPLCLAECGHVSRLKIHFFHIFRKMSQMMSGCRILFWNTSQTSKATISGKYYYYLDVFWKICKKSNFCDFGDFERFLLNFGLKFDLRLFYHGCFKIRLMSGNGSFRPPRHIQIPWIYFFIESNLILKKVEIHHIL